MVGISGCLPAPPIARWAQFLAGRVIEVGCGVGERSKYLQDLGLEVMGVDTDLSLVAQGRQRYPGLAINHGTPAELLASDGFLSGVLAWGSLDQVSSADLPDVFAEFSRVLSPDGSLLLRGVREVSQSALLESAGLRTISVISSGDSVVITAVKDQ